jgi:hypothetical protein
MQRSFAAGTHTPRPNLGHRCMQHHTYAHARMFIGSKVSSPSSLVRSRIRPTFQRLYLGATLVDPAKPHLCGAACAVEVSSIVLELESAV